MLSKLCRHLVSKVGSSLHVSATPPLNWMRNMARDALDVSRSIHYQTQYRWICSSQCFVTRAVLTVRTQVRSRSVQKLHALVAGFFRSVHGDVVDATLLLIIGRVPRKLEPQGLQTKTRAPTPSNATGRVIEKVNGKLFSSGI